MERPSVRSHLMRALNASLGVLPQKASRMLFETLAARQDIAESAGYHVYPRTYFSPLVLRHELDIPALQHRRRLPGIEFNEASALALIDKLGEFTKELADVPYDRSPDEPFWFSNGWFSDFDAASLYAVLRHLRPKRYVELGCGFSSLMSSRALARNATEGSPSDAVYADPYPRTEIAAMLRCGRLVRERVQTVPSELFTALEAGDVLFIDTSHVVKLQSDVVHLLVTVLPSLKPGVVIHLHDIFTPYDYPVDWVTNPLFSCNEQYAVEAMLSGSGRYVVELPLYLLWKEHRDALTRFFPRGILLPGGFWLRKTAAT
jgi:predicted O-methyltransferase YrrM